MTKDIQTIAAELSSGLDSGILSVIASSLAPGKVHTYGLLVMDEFREGQTERRNEFITRFGFKDTSLLAQDFLPFTINMTDAARRKTATWEECYHEAIYELLSAAGQNQDVLLFNGFGGDELFLPYLYEMSSKDRSDYTAEMHVTRKKAPSFIKDELYNAYADTMHSLKKAPKSLMIFSTVEAVAYSSAEYLSHNIWPVSPYCTPELIMFCRSLPRTWRKNRRVQREFLARCGCSPKITHPEKPENFGSVLTCGLQKADLKINALFKKSYLADLGYIDAELFTAAYNYHIDHHGSSMYSDMDFYVVIALEYTMQAWDAECRESATG